MEYLIRQFNGLYSESIDERQRLMKDLENSIIKHSLTNDDSIFNTIDDDQYYKEALEFLILASSKKIIKREERFMEILKYFLSFNLDSLSALNYSNLLIVLNFLLISFKFINKYSGISTELLKHFSLPCWIHMNRNNLKLKLTENCKIKEMLFEIIAKKDNLSQSYFNFFNNFLSFFNLLIKKSFFSNRETSVVIHKMIELLNQIASEKKIRRIVVPLIIEKHICEIAALNKSKYKLSEFLLERLFINIFQEITKEEIDNKINKLHILLSNLISHGSKSTLLFNNLIKFNKENLNDLLDSLSINEIYDMGSSLNILTYNYNYYCSFNQDERKLITSIYQSNFLEIENLKEGILNTSVLGDEVSIFNYYCPNNRYNFLLEHESPINDTESSLNMEDFIIKAFISNGYELMHNIEKVIINEILYLKPHFELISGVDSEEGYRLKGFNGYFDNSTKINSFKFSYVKQNLFSEILPSLVIADIDISLEYLSQRKKIEWNSLNTNEPLYLISFKKSVNLNNLDNDALLLNIKLIRGCFLSKVQNIDENTNRLSVYFEPCLYYKDLVENSNIEEFYSDFHILIKLNEENGRFNMIKIKEKINELQAYKTALTINNYIPLDIQSVYIHKEINPILKDKFEIFYGLQNSGQSQKLISLIEAYSLDNEKSLVITKNSSSLENLLLSIQNTNLINYVFVEKFTTNSKSLSNLISYHSSSTKYINLLKNYIAQSRDLSIKLNYKLTIDGELDYSTILYFLQNSLLFDLTLILANNRKDEELSTLSDKYKSLFNNNFSDLANLQNLHMHISDLIVNINKLKMLVLLKEESQRIDYIKNKLTSVLLVTFETCVSLLNKHGKLINGTIDNKTNESIINSYNYKLCFNYDNLVYYDVDCLSSCQIILPLFLNNDYKIKNTVIFCNMLKEDIEENYLYYESYQVENQELVTYTNHGRSFIYSLLFLHHNNSIKLNITHLNNKEKKQNIEYKYDIASMIQCMYFQEWQYNPDIKNLINYEENENYYLHNISNNLLIDSEKESNLICEYICSFIDFFKHNNISNKDLLILVTNGSQRKLLSEYFFTKGIKFPIVLISNVIEILNEVNDKKLILFSNTNNTKLDNDIISLVNNSQLTRLVILSTESTEYDSGIKLLINQKEIRLNNLKELESIVNE